MRLTDKQKTIVYYRLQGYTQRQIALISGVTDSYVGRVLRDVDDTTLDEWLPTFAPSMDCIIRRKVLDHILSGVGYAYIPRTEKFGYVSLLAYLGYDYAALREAFPDDISNFLYMAIHRSNKAWRDFDPTIIGVNQEDYDNLLKIRRKPNDEQV